MALGLTQMQWIGIGMMVVGIVGMWWFGTRGRLRPAGPIDQPAEALVATSGTAKGKR